jgi:hypothetical protein
LTARRRAETLTAVRRYRETTGAGLAEAERAVERIRAGARAMQPVRAEAHAIVQRRRVPPLLALLALAALFGTVFALARALFAGR